MAFGENQDFGVNFKSTNPAESQDKKFGVKYNTQPVNPEMAHQFSQVDQQKSQEIGREIEPEKQQLKDSKDLFTVSAVNRYIVPFANFLPNGNINIQAGSQGEKTAKYMLEKNLITTEQLAAIISQAKANGTQVENNNNATA